MDRIFPNEEFLLHRKQPPRIEAITKICNASECIIKWNAEIGKTLDNVTDEDIRNQYSRYVEEVKEFTRDKDSVSGFYDAICDIVVTGTMLFEMLRTKTGTISDLKTMLTDNPFPCDPNRTLGLPHGQDGRDLMPLLIEVCDVFSDEQVEFSEYIEYLKKEFNDPYAVIAAVHVFPILLVITNMMAVDVCEIDINRCLNEVSRSNYSKFASLDDADRMEEEAIRLSNVPENGSVVVRKTTSGDKLWLCRERDNKILKPKFVFSEPNLLGLI